MKVKFAAQLYSASVASSLEFLAEQKKYGFINSQATSKFCRIINDAFDILNSRKGGSGFKVRFLKVFNPCNVAQHLFPLSLKTKKYQNLKVDLVIHLLVGNLILQVCVHLFVHPSRPGKQWRSTFKSENSVLGGVEGYWNDFQP